MHDFARYRAAKTGQEIEGGITDFFNCDSALERRIVFVPLQNVAEVADARSGQCLDGTC